MEFVILLDLLHEINSLDRYLEEARSYMPEQKGVLELGLVRQHRHPDGCAHMELAGRPDTFSHMRVTSEKKYYTTNIAYRWQGRAVVVCRIVIGRLHV